MNIQKCILLGLFVVGLSMSLTAAAQSAETYEAGHGALQVFDEAGMAATPQWVKVWLGLMLTTFFAGLFFVWKQPLARWAVGGFLCSFLLTGFIFEALALPYLSGAIAIGHQIFWSPALVLLLLRRPFLEANQGQLFRIWSALMTFVIAFSFVFDVRDAFIYIRHFAG